MPIGAPACAMGEMLAVLLARDMADGEKAIVGTNSDIQVAACNLARQRQAPHLWWVSGPGGMTNPSDGIIRPAADAENIAVAEAVMDLPQMIDFIDWQVHFFDFAILGALQTDRFGNINTVCIGDHARPRLRGPGTVGISALCGLSRRFYIMMTRHDRGAFVPKVDFVCGAGFLDGGTSRTDRGLPEGGPRLVVTPLGVFDFEPASKAMRVKSLHDGVTLEEVRDNTGFDLVVPDDHGAHRAADCGRIVHAATPGRHHRRPRPQISLAKISKRPLTRRSSDEQLSFRRAPSAAARSGAAHGGQARRADRVRDRRELPLSGRTRRDLRRHGPAAALGAAGVWRPRRRPDVGLPRQGGDRQGLRVGRTAGREQFVRPDPADPQLRHRGAEAALSRPRRQGPHADRRRHHRGRHRLGRLVDEDARRAGRRKLGAERSQDLHHLRLGRAFHPGVRAHQRRQGRRRHLGLPGRHQD